MYSCSSIFALHLPMEKPESSKTDLKHIKISHRIEIGSDLGGKEDRLYFSVSDFSVDQ